MPNKRLASQRSIASETHGDRVRNLWKIFWTGSWNLTISPLKEGSRYVAQENFPQKNRQPSFVVDFNWESFCEWIVSSFKGILIVQVSSFNIFDPLIEDLKEQRGTPQKTNMDTQNSHVWRELPFPDHHFGYPTVSFGECISFCRREIWPQIPRDGIAKVGGPRKMCAEPSINAPFRGLVILDPWKTQHVLVTWWHGV